MEILKKIGKIFEEALERANPLKGGEGDKLEYSDVDPKELAMGIRVEFEHINSALSAKVTDAQIENFIKGITTDLDAEIINTLEYAADIAMDHLSELKDYYTRLQRMEVQGKKELGIKGEENNAEIMDNSLSGKK